MVVLIGLPSRCPAWPGNRRQSAVGSTDASRGGVSVGGACPPCALWYSCGNCLRLDKGFGDCLGRNRLAVVVADRPQAADELRRQRELDQVEHLGVAILLDHVDAV